MRTRTLTDLIADVRNRINMETSSFLTDSEITEYLNQALSELWVRICMNGGQPFYRATTTLNVVAGQTLYTLPADFLNLQGVEATINGWTGRIDPFMSSEHARLSNGTMAGISVVSPVRYRLQAGVIEFLPNIYAFPATLFYTPTCPRLVNGSDTFDGFGGLEVAAIYQACATCQAKEESDPSFYMAERDRIYKHIDAVSAARDLSATERVQDVMGGLDDYSTWTGGFWR
jgi:hypothetical protein